MRKLTTVWDGKTITKPGIYADVPLEAYHSQTILDGPSVSSSQLRRVLEENGGSPAHMYCEWSGNPDCIDDDTDNKSLILGRATHHLLLGQADFGQWFILEPAKLRDKAGLLVRFNAKEKGARNTWEYQEWKQRCLRGGYRWNDRNFAWSLDEKQPPLTILSEADVDNIRGMSSSLAQHAIVKQGILRGQVERSFFWKDKATRLWLKARPDAIPTDSGDFSDLKTTTSVQWVDLIKTTTNYAYHQQAALVVEGAKVCANVEFSSFSFVFVEKKPPYCSRVVVLKPDYIALGMKQNRRALNIIANCIKAKRWPGPGDEHVSMIDLIEHYRAEAEANCAVREAS
jgi:hypothetical protein